MTDNSGPTLASIKLHKTSTIFCKRTKTRHKPPEPGMGAQVLPSRAPTSPPTTCPAEPPATLSSHLAPQCTGSLGGGINSHSSCQGQLRGHLLLKAPGFPRVRGLPAALHSSGCHSVSGCTCLNSPKKLARSILGTHRGLVLGLPTDTQIQGCSSP